MEEQVGELWHRWISRRSDRRHAQAKVHLADCSAMLAIVFRAMGGDRGLSIKAATERTILGPRQWLARIAGRDARRSPAALDDQSLLLPPEISVFPDKQLNRDLYIWLAAQAAAIDRSRDLSQPTVWFQANCVASARVLQAWPGLRRRYKALVHALLLGRLAPDSLPAEAGALERQLRASLIDPIAFVDGDNGWPGSASWPEYLGLWIYPGNGATQNDTNSDGQPSPNKPSNDIKELSGRRNAKRHIQKTDQAPFVIPFRAESLLSMAQFVRVNRADDDDDDDDLDSAASSLDEIALANPANASAAKVRFDLSLPVTALEEQVLREGILLPEWDWRRATLLPDVCRVTEYAFSDLPAIDLPDRLRLPVRRLRREIEARALSRRLVPRLDHGNDIDLDAYLRFRAERAQNEGACAADGLYRDQRTVSRDLSCLLLADLSLSTEAHVNDRLRVIDVIQDAAMMFAETLSGLGDRFAIQGFSSLRRQQVRIHRIKDFEGAYDGVVRARIQKMKPGYYTRMGAAIRHGAKSLAQQTSTHRLLLLLTDGKPHDIDHYEGRFGIEDTRRALHEVRQAGMTTFCVTVDPEGGEYLPHLFGRHRYAVVTQPERLSQELVRLYAQLTQD